METFAFIWLAFGNRKETPFRACEESTHNAEAKRQIEHVKRSFTQMRRENFAISSLGWMLAASPYLGTLRSAR